MPADKKRENQRTTANPLTVDEALTGLLATETPAKPTKPAKRRASDDASTPNQTPPEQAEQAEQAGTPKIELLYFAGCPNYLRALAALREVMASLEMTAPIDLVAVETQEEAKRQQFYGSPTIRVNGVDIVRPNPSAQPALVCRVYRRADGALTPIPPAAVMAVALRRA